MVSMNSFVLHSHPGPAAGGDDIVVVEELALDQAAHDGVAGSREDDIAAVGVRCCTSSSSSLPMQRGQLRCRVLLGTMIRMSLDVQ